MKNWSILVLASLSLSTMVRAESDFDAGKRLAAVCMGCHGADGTSLNDEWPNLARQKKDYLAKQLRALRSGERKHPLMKPIADNLNDGEIAALTVFFSTLKKEP